MSSRQMFSGDRRTDVSTCKALFIKITVVCNICLFYFEKRAINQSYACNKVKSEADPFQSADLCIFP